MIDLKSIASKITSNHTCSMSSSPEMIINELGNKEYGVNGELHREDGPAIESRNGYKEWYLNGKNA